MLISVVLPLALAIIMWSLGLGLTVADFHRVLVRSAAFFTGAVAQIVIVPVCAFLLVLAFGLTGELAVGVMILSFCPGGVTSNLISRLARGDVALSVSLTAVVSLLSMLTVPFLVAWSVARFMGTDAPSVNITSLGVSMFLITALPVLIGVAMRHYLPGLVDRIERAVSLLAVGLFVIIVLAALVTNWSLFVENVAVLGPILILLNVVLIAVGLGLAKPQAVARGKCGPSPWKRACRIRRSA